MRKMPKWKRKHRTTFKSKSKFHSWYDQLWPLYGKFDSLRGKCFMFILMLLMTIVFPRVFQLLWFLKIDFFDNNLRTNKQTQVSRSLEWIDCGACVNGIAFGKKINNENLSTSEIEYQFAYRSKPSHILLKIAAGVANHAKLTTSSHIFFLELFKWNSFRWSWNGADDVCSIAYI